MLLKASRQIARSARFAALIGLIVVVPIHAGESIVSAIGVVESVDCQSQTIKILGVTFAAIDADSAAAVCGVVGSAGLRYVSASGTANSSGTIVLSKLTTLSTGSYVPGATPVYITGSISEARINTGEIVVGGAVVSSPAIVLKSGSIVEVLGTQPVPGGLILPANVRVVESSGLDGAGSAANSSVSFGFTTNSSIGSGAKTNSSIGSGASTNSSIGSGAKTNSSIGSGASTNSSIGSGATTNSSIGSGVSTNSSIGSGAKTNSSIGSGASTNSSIGSGSL